MDTVASELQPSSAPPADDRLARRNAIVLALAQAFGGALMSITVALGGLAGIYLLSGNTPLVTLPVTTMIVGTACGTLPAAYLLERLGRRRGFILGTLVSFVGGVISCVALHGGSFALFCFGTFFAGLSFAFVQQYRFAAAEAASLSFKPKAISTVLAGGILAGVVGPQTVIASKDMMLPVPYAGAYLAHAGLSLVALVILAFYRPPAPAVRQVAASGGRSLWRIMTEPKVALAVACAMLAYSVMTLVMTAAPLAMIACGFTAAQAALGIQWHIIAMFGPSFFTGHLVNRFGAELITAAGLVLLLAAGIVALLGIELINFYGALILLGLGWNFGFIGGTAMLTAAQRPEERARTQAANDFIVFGVVAVASLSSGVLFNWVGWESINLTVIPMVALPFVLLIGVVIMSARRHSLA